MKNAAPMRTDVTIEKGHDAHEQAEPHTAQGSGQGNPGVTEPSRNPLHHFEVVSDNGDMLDGELLVGKIIHRLLGIEIGSVRAHGVAFRDAAGFLRGLRGTENVRHTPILSHTHVNRLKFS
jgi:hypothetical protein